MPKQGIKRTASSRPLTQQETLNCSWCDTAKKPSEFYQSFDPDNKSGYINICKKCFNKECMEYGNVVKTKMKNVLKKINKPYLEEVYNMAVESGGAIPGNYMRILTLPKYKYLEWEHSSDVDVRADGAIISNVLEVTDEIREFFGAGYTDEEYLAMQRKYNYLKNNYKEKTNMHTEALITYIRYQVKAEIATAKNQVTDAKNWAAMAKDAGNAAKINPSQFSVSDLQDGLSTFGQVTRAVEQHIDIIPILPHFKEKPQDKVDFTLFCYINYIRDLKGLPACEYKDIYRFYQDRIKEHKDRFDFLNEADNVEDGSEN